MIPHIELAKEGEAVPWRQVAFSVYGTPVPKGSTKAFWRPGMRHAVVTHDNAKTKSWQEAVVAAALDALHGAPPAEGAVAVRLRFYMPRPASAPRRIVEPCKKPDLDKLVRCMLDGLKRAGVYRDDSQVVLVVARKVFAGGRDDERTGVPRAQVSVQPIEVEPCTDAACGV